MFGSHSVLHSQESSGNSGSRKGVTHPSIVVIHEIKKPTEKEVSELLCYKSITQTNKKKIEFCFEKLGSAIKKKSVPGGFDSCGNNLFWCRSKIQWENVR